MKSRLINDDCSINDEELKKILAAAKTSDFYNPNAKKIFKKLLTKKNNNKSKHI